MRGGVARWKRGVGGRGIASAAAYAFNGACDAGHDHSADEEAGTIAAARYAGSTVDRFTVTDSGIAADVLDVDQLQTWFGGGDPHTGDRRGRDLTTPSTDLVFDATVNAPKSFSLAAVLDPDIADAYEALQDRLRDRIITLWQQELNARRGAGGRRREEIAQLEVVELRHERSRALDAHKHRHLWLNARVLGRDGKWSSLDSRVMLRFQNVVNAEGDLAARTDPEWVAALAAKGYTLDADGEIAQLAGIVRPLSRRSNQIEANRAARLAQWEAEHPGQEPGHDVLMAIDRWAWAHQRPGKPGHVDEDEWLDTVRREIADIDPAIVTAGDRPPAPVTARAIADIDRDALAAMAVADADGRSSGNGGRFSDFDVRAGAVRAVAAAGLVADRSQLTELIEDVTARAITDGTIPLTDEGDVPGHVKHRMATSTFGTKVMLADRFDGLNIAGERVDVDTVTATATEVLPADRTLDAGQTEAAGAIAGTDRLVTVTGPAGTGKTTMLQVARTLLDNQGRRMVIVAPTKKAATVAGEATGADASSLHALLHDYGFRWEDTPMGQSWTRLLPGEADPRSGVVYEGPARFALSAGDRIVVDEAGMVDLHTANALAAVAADTGAGIAMVGDHLQALPVGHSGAMSLLRTRSGAVVELTAVHRFTDPAWADLSLRIREPGQHAGQVAQEIIDRGHAALVATDADARGHMVTEWLAGHAAGQRVTLVTATHDEAQAISEAIQARLIDTGHLNTNRPVTLQGGQVGYVGDIIQTRRNDSRLDVENRQVWTVRDVATGVDGTATITLAAIDDPGITRAVSGEYLAAHAHLSYAATVHGVQGETADRSIVGPGVDAAGLYVGLTRGRTRNDVVIVADSAKDAREQLVETMQRGRIEATIDDARAAVRTDLAHAARTPHVPPTDDNAPAPWHDRAARPLGHLLRIGEILTDATEREKALHEQITRLSEKIHTDQTALDELTLAAAAWEARAHAADVDGTDPGPAPLRGPAQEKLTQRLTVARQERSTLSHEYRQVSQRIAAAQREQAIRDALGADVTAFEDDARRRALQERHAHEAAAWDDRKHRPFGREVALLARRVATRSELAAVDAERDERAARLQAARDMLRGEAGPGGVVLTADQRDRVVGLVETATRAYDDAVQRHTKLAHRLRGIDREQTIRASLAAADEARDTRIAQLQQLLEHGVDETGETINDRARERARTELADLTTQPARARVEERARRLGHDQSRLNAAGPTTAMPAGPSRRGPELG